MNPFDYHSELQHLVSSKQLVEVNLRGDTEHAVAYLINFNDEYLTFAKISNDTTLQGVVTCLTTDLESIQVETNFIAALSKNIKDDSLHNEAMRILEKVDVFSFEGIATALQGTDRLIEIITVDNENYSGKVIALDGTALVLDEYYPQDTNRFARTYLNPSLISRITLGGAWLNITASSLLAK